MTPLLSPRLALKLPRLKVFVFYDDFVVAAGKLSLSLSLRFFLLLFSLLLFVVEESLLLSLPLQQILNPRASKYAVEEWESTLFRPLSFIQCELWQGSQRRRQSGLRASNNPPKANIGGRRGATPPPCAQKLFLQAR